jgi:hypothetical protein
MSGDDDLALVLRIPVFSLSIIVYTLTHKGHVSISIIIFSLISSSKKVYYIILYFSFENIRRSTKWWQIWQTLFSFNCWRKKYSKPCPLIGVQKGKQVQVFSWQEQVDIWSSLSISIIIFSWISSASMFFAKYVLAILYCVIRWYWCCPSSFIRNLSSMA